MGGRTARFSLPAVALAHLALAACAGPAEMPDASTDAAPDAAPGIDECALGTPCGVGVGSCTDTPSGYSCTCISGYSAPPTGGRCSEVDECHAGTDTCDHEPPSCTDTVGSFLCRCPPSFTGSGVGMTGCLLTDPTLSSLVPSVGVLSPAFAGTTGTYSLALPVGVTTVSLTPSVRYPANATITVDGSTVASGVASSPVSLVGFAPRAVTVAVTTDSGAMRRYTVIVGRGDVYVKASNTGRFDGFGWAVALSGDGSTLAVGAIGESSNATGIGGDQTDDSAPTAGAVYVFTRAGTSWSQQAYVKASNTGRVDGFGGSVALSSDGSTLAVGASGEASSASGVGGDQMDDSAPGAGAVYVFTRAGGTWSQQAYIKASNTDAMDEFGFALGISGDGSTLAVGAQWEASSARGVGGDQADNSASSAGAVYVFARAGSTWTQVAYVKASNTGSGSEFGTSVALSADGSALAVGAIGESSSATGVDGDQTTGVVSEAGAVYAFTRSGAVWSQQAYLKASNTDAGDYFGHAVALSSDGSTLAVGAHGEASSATGVGGDQTDNTARWAGAVYVFTRVGTTWSQEAYVKASNTDTFDGFGSAVALSSDGSTLAVSAVGEASTAISLGGTETDDRAPGAGAAYVFTRAGSAWSQLAYVKASNTDAADNFGSAVALSSDGSTLAVGADREDSNAIGIGGDELDNSAANAGAVYVY